MIFYILNYPSSFLSKRAFLFIQFGINKKKRCIHPKKGGVHTISPVFTIGDNYLSLFLFTKEKELI